MRQLTIYRRYFTQADCFVQGTVQEQNGVQVHSTGANNPLLKRYVQPDDGRLGTNFYHNDHNRPGKDVCAHAYIGKLKDGTVAVYQTLPWNYRCWLSGSGANGNANKLGFVGFEVCEDGLQDRNYFEEAVLNKAVLLTAHLCDLLGVSANEVLQQFPEGPLLAVEDHSELNAVKLASNHKDISSWLRRFGWTMTMFRREVTDALAEGVAVTYIDADTGNVISKPDSALDDPKEDDTDERLKEAILAVKTAYTTLGITAKAFDDAVDRLYEALVDREATHG